MSPLNAPNTAHLMPGEAVPDMVTAWRLMQLGFMHHDDPLSRRPIPASPASTAIRLQAAACAGLPYDPSWAAHLDYLRALQRKGREMLARAAPEELSPCRWDDVGSLDVR
jgi:hypothetical protein